MTARRSYKVRPDVHSRRFHDELVVLDLVRGEYFALDEVGARIWTALSSGLTLDETVATLVGLYDTDVAQIHADASAFVQELEARQLIVPLEPLQ